jgi:hypothetical protein
MWIEIFKSGKWTDSQGREKEWTDSDLDVIVAAYNPADPAPAVIGHPQENAPAYGWFDGLKREGSALLANLTDVVPEFMEMLKSRMFRKRSMSVYPDMRLRHVGFLGAQPPAVKGLADIRFAEGEPMIFEFSAKEATRMKFRDYFTKKAKEEGIELEDLDLLNPPKGGSAFTEADIQKRIDEQVAEKTKNFSTELEQERARTRRLEAANRRNEFSSFCDGLIDEGRLTPAQRTAALDFMEILSGTESFEFSEGDKKEKKAPAEAFKAFLNTLPKQIEFAELATKGKARSGEVSDAKREEAISNYMEKHTDADYKEAVLAVSRTNPELFEGR